MPALRDSGDAAFEDSLALYRGFDTDVLEQLQRYCHAEQTRATAYERRRTLNSRLALIAYVLRERVASTAAD